MPRFTLHGRVHTRPPTRSAWNELNAEIKLVLQRDFFDHLHPHAHVELDENGDMFRLMAMDIWTFCIEPEFGGGQEGSINREHLRQIAIRRGNSIVNQRVREQIRYAVRRTLAHHGWIDAQGVPVLQYWFEPYEDIPELAGYAPDAPDEVPQLDWWIPTEQELAQVALNTVGTREETARDALLLLVQSIPAHHGLVPLLEDMTQVSRRVLAITKK